MRWAVGGGGERWAPQDGMFFCTPQSKTAQRGGGGGPGGGVRTGREETRGGGGPQMHIVLVILGRFIEPMRLASLASEGRHGLPGLLKGEAQLIQKGFAYSPKRFLIIPAPSTKWTPIECQKETLHTARFLPLTDQVDNRNLSVRSF